MKDFENDDKLNADIAALINDANIENIEDNFDMEENTAEPENTENTESIEDNTDNAHTEHKESAIERRLRELNDGFSDENADLFESLFSSAPAGTYNKHHANAAARRAKKQLERDAARSYEKKSDEEAGYRVRGMMLKSEAYDLESDITHGPAIVRWCADIIATTNSAAANCIYSIPLTRTTRKINTLMPVSMLDKIKSSAASVKSNQELVDTGLDIYASCIDTLRSTTSATHVAARTSAHIVNEIITMLTLVEQ